MEVIETGIQDLIQFKPKVFGDERGFFVESFNCERYRPNLPVEFDAFVQDNISASARGTLRGLHFQQPPYAQAKLVMVTQGKALDVAVDLRSQSPTYGQHYAVVLDAQLMNQLFIPRGFAHGFLALEDNTIFQYKCDNLYQKVSEGTLKWNDPDLGIDWMIDNPLVSEKDKSGLTFLNFSSPF